MHWTLVEILRDNITCGVVFGIGTWQSHRLKDKYEKGCRYI